MTNQSIQIHFLEWIFNANANTNNVFIIYFHIFYLNTLFCFLKLILQLKSSFKIGLFILSLFLPTINISVKNKMKMNGTAGNLSAWPWGTTIRLLNMLNDIIISKFATTILKINEYNPQKLKTFKFKNKNFTSKNWK